jgi:hypothetical protein
MKSKTDINTLSPIIFSPWIPWTKRHEIPKSDLPGVYLLARFSVPPLDINADPISQQIVVIGQTRRTLLKRWAEFHAAAFGSGHYHTEGSRYRLKNYPDALETLYVAAMPSSPLQWKNWAKTDDENLAKMLNSSTDEIRQFKRYIESSASIKTKGVFNNTWIMYVERLLLVRFVFEWDRLPECNAE